jgi:hypothetical protein
VNTASTIDWKSLQGRHSPVLVVILRRFFESGGPFELTPGELIADSDLSTQQGLALLSDEALQGVLIHERRLRCFNCSCLLSREGAAGETCPECDEAFSDHPPGTQVVDVFKCERAPTRDVLWVLTLHGMNTRGEWQEDLNWLVSKAFSRMVPVAIYKYGLVRTGAFLRFRQRHFTQEIVRKLKALAGETTDAGFGGRPDVIAHSFGTWLLGHALQTDSTLRVGRIILTGSILRPDFDWQPLLVNGQVQAVLNHYGTRDFWARWAHYFIPDSGPSGRGGFNQSALIFQVPAANFGHSEFFRPDRMREEFAGLWQSFLTLPLADLPRIGSSGGRASPWKQTQFLFRATLPRYILLSTSFSFVMIAIYCLFLGFMDIVSKL